MFSVSCFQINFYEFVYGLITFYSGYSLSLVVYLSIPALISGLHKMPQTLDFPFYNRFRYLRGSSYSLRRVTIFCGIITIGSHNSLVNSNWGVFIHKPHDKVISHIITIYERPCSFTIDQNSFYRQSFCCLVLAIVIFYLLIYRNKRILESIGINLNIGTKQGQFK